MTSHVRVQTASRNQRSWVTTSSAPRRAVQVVGQPGDRPRRRGGWSARRGRAGRPAGPARRPARPAAVRRRTAARRRESSPNAANPRPPRTSRTAASPAHSCTAASPTTRSRTVAPSGRCPRWVTVAISTPPVRVTRPESGVSAPVIRRKQRRLAAAVAPDDADPLAGGQAEGDVDQHRRRAVRLADAFDVDEVAADRCHQRITRAPTTGPVATRVSRQVARDRQRGRDLRGRRRRRGAQERAGRPRSGDDAAERTGGRARPPGCRCSDGVSANAAGCRSLCMWRADGPGVTRAQRLEHPVRHGRVAVGRDGPAGP